MDLGFVSEDLEQRGIFAKEVVYPEDPLEIQKRKKKVELTSREELEQKGILKKHKGPPKKTLDEFRQKKDAELRAREKFTHSHKGMGH